MIHRIPVISFIVLVFLTCLSGTQNFAKKQKDNNIPDKLTGVYEFVSESTDVTKPRKTTYKRSVPEWSGVWHFQNGHYTRILMKRKRERFYNSKKLGDFGFESFSGTYKIEEDGIRLEQDCAFNPYDVGGSIYLEYKIEGDRLTLTQSLYPHLEDLREGTITIVLHRLK